MDIRLNSADLRPLITDVVRVVLDDLEVERAKLSERLAFPEPEAAALLGVAPYVLRDARLRGEIDGCRVGKRILYERDELVRFLRSRRGL